MKCNICGGEHDIYLARSIPVEEYLPDGASGQKEDDEAHSNVACEAADT